MRKNPTSTYDELAERHRGGSPRSAEGARRRSDSAAAARLEPGSVTDVTPDEITSGALALGKLRAGLRVPAIDGEGLRALRERIDDNVGFVAPIIGNLLQTFPKVATSVDQSPQQIGAEVRQRTEMYQLACTATQIRSDVMDTRRQTSGAVRAYLKDLVEHIRRQLEPGRLPKQDQERLRSDATEILRAWEVVEQQPQQERKKTVALDRAHDEKLEEEREYAELLGTMLALQSGEAVDQAEWDRAAEAYDALSEKVERRNRRTRSR